MLVNRPVAFLGVSGRRQKARKAGVIINVVGNAADTHDPECICGVAGNAASTRPKVREPQLLALVPSDIPEIVWRISSPR
jgi:hypothetical protein